MLPPRRRRRRRQSRAAAGSAASISSHGTIHVGGAGQPDARKARREHREVTAAPHMWLDAALGRLLDLQDDLADAVFWLAETWSAELPIPRLRLGTVPLQVLCDTGADLDRVARVLDTAVTGGRAVRYFGRVRIDGVTPGGRVG